MQGRRIVMALAICLLSLAASEGASLQRSVTDLRCQCPKTEPGFINPKQIEKVEIITSGSHCPNIEVILTLKSQQRTCVDPKAPWVKKIIDRYLESATQKNEIQP